MRIRMRVEVSGTRDGNPWPLRGQIAEFDDEEALELCGSGIAEPVKSEKTPVEYTDSPSATRAAARASATSTPSR